ncbi:Hpt domain-containing protein [Brevundimonas sp.]|uniref:Hpt domain-containing protein n=1 Tax=Brevundimonas sp. TaxID=1871086 RepID=UPI00391C7F4B
MTDMLAALKARFLERCAGDLDRLERLMASDALGSDEMRFLAHSLSGAAGTFGFPEISAAAAVADEAFADGGAPDRAQAEHLAQTLRQALTPED